MLSSQLVVNIFFKNNMQTDSGTFSSWLRSGTFEKLWTELVAQAFLCHPLPSVWSWLGYCKSGVFPSLCESVFDSI